jgi:hypothetical protein
MGPENKSLHERVPTFGSLKDEATGSKSDRGRYRAGLSVLQLGFSSDIPFLIPTTRSPNEEKANITITLENRFIDVDRE